MGRKRYRLFLQSDQPLIFLINFTVFDEVILDKVTFPYLLAFPSIESRSQISSFSNFFEPKIFDSEKEMFHIFCSCYPSMTLNFFPCLWH
jgi:hypothetical protein